MTSANDDCPDWTGELVMTTTVERLTMVLEQLRQEELRRFTKRLVPEEAASLDELTAALVQRVIQALLGQSETVRHRDEGAPVLQVLTALFNLHPPPARTPH